MKKKYKVRYEGFVYVVAESKSKARHLAQHGYSLYDETSFYDPEEVPEFLIGRGMIMKCPNLIVVEEVSDEDSEAQA